MEHKYGIYKIWSNYEVIKYTYAPLVKEISESEERIKMILDKYSEKNHTSNFTIFYEEEIIGAAGCPTVDFNKGEYGLFYQLNQDYWGKGFGYEVAKALVNYMFAESNAKILLADAVTVNLGSIKILEKIGMEKIKVEEDGFKNNGQELDKYHYKLER
jgi:ribosomal-protein-alanine N-acetyltransferase